MKLLRRLMPLFVLLLAAACSGPNTGLPATATLVPPAGTLPPMATIPATATVLPSATIPATAIPAAPSATPAADAANTPDVVVSQFLKAPDDLAQVSDAVQAALQSGLTPAGWLAIPDLSGPFTAQTVHIERARELAQVEVLFEQVNPLTRDFFLGQRDGQWVILSVVRYDLPPLQALPPDRLAAAQVVQDFVLALQMQSPAAAQALLTANGQAQVDSAALAAGVQQIAPIALTLQEASADRLLFQVDLWVTPAGTRGSDWVAGLNERWFSLALTEAGWLIEAVTVTPPGDAAAGTVGWQPVATLPVDFVYALSWAAGDQQLLFADETGVWGVGRDGSGRVQLFAAPSQDARYELSPAGVLAQLLNESVAQLYYLSSGQPAQALTVGPAIGLALSPDGRTLAAASAERIAATLFDIVGDRPQRTLNGFETAAPVYSIRFSDNGQTLIWLARGTVQLMDVASGQPGPRFEHEDFVGALALARDGRTLATASYGTVDNNFGPVVTLWDTAGAPAISLPQAQPVISLAFAPDGQLLALGMADGTVQLLDMATQQVVAVLNGDGSSVNFLAFSADGQLLAAAGQALTLWQRP